MSPEKHDLLLDLEDHLSYVRDAKNDLQLAIDTHCPKPSYIQKLRNNLHEAEMQVRDIRVKLRETE